MPGVNGPFVNTICRSVYRVFYGKFSIQDGVSTRERYAGPDSDGIQKNDHFQQHGVSVSTTSNGIFLYSIGILRPTSEHAIACL